MTTAINSNTFSITLPCIFTILTIIGKWAIFEKMGEDGWKVLIPFYGEYTLYKRVWNKKMYWITLVLTVLTFPLITVVTFAAYGYVDSMAILYAGFFLAMLLMLALIVMKLMLVYKLSTSFGQGKAFTVGLLMVSSVFYMILGFGKYEYARA